MAYCKNCGKEISDEAVVCPHCGVQVKQLATTTTSGGADDTGGFGWGLLGFCIPIVGLILYLVWMNSKPLNAKAAGTGALIGFVLGVISGIISATLGA